MRCSARWCSTPCCRTAPATRWTQRRIWSGFSWAGIWRACLPATAADDLASRMCVTNIEDVKRWYRTHEALWRAEVVLIAEAGFDATETGKIAARAHVSE